MHISVLLFFTILIPSLFSLEEPKTKVTNESNSQLPNKNGILKKIKRKIGKNFNSFFRKMGFSKKSKGEKDPCVFPKKETSPLYQQFMDEHEKSLKNLCNTDSRIKDVINLVNTLENGKEILKKILKTLKNSKKENNSKKERVLKEQFSIYKGKPLSDPMNEFRKFVDKNKSDKVFDTKLVIQFLQVLQFCATIKHTYEPSIRPTLMLYCKFIVLPRAREVLNSVGIEYSFGKFSIKIDNDNEGKKDPMKTEEWLVEEKSVEKWSPKLETIEEEN